MIQNIGTGGGRCIFLFVIFEEKIQFEIRFLFIIFNILVRRDDKSEAAGRELFCLLFQKRRRVFLYPSAALSYPFQMLDIIQNGSIIRVLLVFAKQNIVTALFKNIFIKNDESIHKFPCND